MEGPECRGSDIDVTEHFNVIGDTIRAADTEDRCWKDDIEYANKWSAE
jgi:hypothetical protein